MSNENEVEKTEGYLSLPQKPLDIFHEIYNELNQYGEKFTASKDEMITFFGKDDLPCFTFITTGRFSVYRKQDDLLMHSSSSPSMLGIVEYLQPRNAQFFLADTECTGFKIDAKLACEILTKNDLWEKICQIQTYIIQVLQTRDSQLVGVNAYLIIKNKLLELLQEPEEIRMKQSVLLYIQLRSKLSKSLVSKILSALRSGHYIVMEKGKLISITHLPKAY